MKLQVTFTPNYFMPLADTEYRTNNTGAFYGTYGAAKGPSLLELAPNPAKNELYASYQLPLNYTTAQLELHNALGQTVALIDVSNYRHLYKLSLQNYKSGMYLLSLVVDGSLVQTEQINIHK